MSRSLPHIAIDATAINSPTGTVLRHLLAHLQQKDRAHRYTVILKEQDRGVWQPSSDLFEPIFADVQHYSISVQTVMLKILRRLKPDLTYFFMPDQPLLHTGRTVTTFHDFTMQRLPPSGSPIRFRTRVNYPLGQLAFWWAARKSCHIMTPSDYTRAELLKRYRTDPAKVTTVYNGVDVTRGRLEPFPHNFDQFLLYVGQHGWHKNIRRLCLAHQKLIETRPGLGLILAGRIDRSVTVNKDWVEHLGLHNIQFTGFLPDAQRDWLYKHAAAYVFPSLFEGFGVPGVEAMALGAPVVSSDATCLPEIYGDAAMYFDAENVDEMAAAIGRVLDEPTIRDRLIRAGDERWRRYSYDVMTRQVLDVFEACLG